MAKLAQSSVKYVIHVEFKAEGVVEKPDVIGALFGQTEGLMGDELDMREMQRTGKIGRIDVRVVSKKGKSAGTIGIPSSLDSTETALMAATIETIERVGPCDAKMKVKGIEDLRSVKRDYIVGRARDLLSGLVKETPEVSAVSEKLREDVRSSEITKYKTLHAGPEVKDADSIIVVEGRADVIKLLKNGIKNALAIGGTSVPSKLGPISREKEVIAFLDGDRGGDLILKELLQVADIDFVARAPQGKEVEELTNKELFKALREKVPVGQAKQVSEKREHAAPPAKPEEERKAPRIVKVTRARSETRDRRPFGRRETAQRRPFGRGRRDERPRFGRESRMDRPPRRARLSAEDSSFFKKQLEDITGKKAASIFSKGNKFAGRVPLKELENAVKQVSNPESIVVDCEVVKDISILAEKSGVRTVVGTSVDSRIRPRGINVYGAKDL